AAAMGPPRHKTLSLHELHQVGANGLPVSHRTLQVIEATVDGLERYPYRFDTSEVTIEVGLGSQGIVGPLYRVTETIWAIDLALSSPLARGEQTTLEYVTHFHYATNPEPAFRR